MRFGKIVCVVVDAYSTGKYIAPALKGRGYESIHIQSSPNLPPEKFTHRKEDFLISFVYSGDIQLLKEQLKDYQVKLCVPGSESGVEIADALSEALSLPSNGTAYSLARRNKYYMGEVVSAAGLKTVKQIKSNDSQQILEWARREVSQYPIVLKPLDSASGDGVYFCNNSDDINDAHQKLLSSSNIFGQKNSEVLAQSFNYGQEYIVNTVSWNGKHMPVEMWRIYKKPKTIIYDRAEIVGKDEKEFFPIIQYTMKVLNALHIRYGAGTTEVKYTPDGGPVLLESAARLMGSAPLSFSNELFGYNQLSLMVDAYLNPCDFFNKLTFQNQTTEKYGMTVVLTSECKGVLQADVDTDEIKKLNTLHSFVIDGDKGSLLKETVDSLTAPGEIYLISDNKKDLFADYKKIRAMESAGLYKAAISGEKFEYNIRDNQRVLLWNDIPTVDTDSLDISQANMTVNQQLQH